MATETLHGWPQAEIFLPNSASKAFLLLLAQPVTAGKSFHGTAMLRISGMLFEQRDAGLSKGHRAGRDSRNSKWAFAISNSNQ